MVALIFRSLINATFVLLEDAVCRLFKIFCSRFVRTYQAAVAMYFYGCMLIFLHKCGTLCVCVCACVHVNVCVCVCARAHSACVNVCVHACM